MTHFGTSRRFGDGLIREVITYEDISDLPLSQWTVPELGWRLAWLFPRVDGYGNLDGDGFTDVECTEADRIEIAGLQSELKRRGYDPLGNLRINERIVGWGWLDWFYDKAGNLKLYPGQVIRSK